MEGVLYNILWIDDEHERFISLKGQAKRNGINLIGFKSKNGGLEELKKKCSYYDGILLDAKIFENEDDEPGSEDTLFVHRAKDEILQLKKKFEISVLTGQSESYNDTTFIKAFPNVYNKADEKDLIKLFDDLKSAAAELDDTQLKHYYQNIIKVCEDRYIGANQFERVFSLIKDIENKESIEMTKDMFTTIRKVVEVLIERLGQLSIIPQEILYNKGWISKSCYFLLDKHYEYEHTEEFIHPLVSYNIEHILSLTNDSSHASGKLNYNLENYLLNNNSDYLYRSTINLLFDVLIWFKDFIDGHLYVEENKKLWRKKITDEIKIDDSTWSDSGWIEGEVIERDNNRGKGFAFFKSDFLVDNAFITSLLVQENSLEDKLKIIAKVAKDYNDKYRVIDIQ